jgi:hypothetical protein
LATAEAERKSNFLEPGPAVAATCRHELERSVLFFIPDNMKRLRTMLVTPSLLAAAVLGQQGIVQAAAPIAQLEDKTLVAWVVPANASQRGGSALTLMEGEDFDAIVLGERVPGRWMAGSDFFRRTQGEAEQKANAEETGLSNTMVQVAIVYAGERISIFRDGQAYASYSVSQARPFGRETAVLIGVRCLASMGAIGFFHGAIEEARLYDVALDAKTIASLQPNRPSDPKPIGQWTFEDGSTADAMGRFPPGELRGGARVAGGKLWLNGTDAYMVSAPPDTDNQAMFYAPKRPETGTMWDTWLYHHAGVYHLYYLARAGREWDNISMATSTDGVHWKERGVILRKAEGVTWMGTGFTWRSPNHAKDGKFQLNFSEWRGGRQTIFFAESTNLLDWQRLGPEFEFKQDERWYKPKGCWDCIYPIAREEGGLFGYWTADPKERAGVGFGWSLDGVRWEALEPPLFLGGAPHGEAGAVERIGNRYYLMLGAGGMKTLVGEKPQGPFRPAAKNLTLLQGGPTYFSRFFPTNPDGLLVNHHAIAKNGRVHLGLLKRAAVDAEGTLRLAWWPGNDRLKHERIPIRLPPEASARSLTMLDNELPTDEGVILEGTLPPSGGETGERGLYVECRRHIGLAILVRPGGAVDFGSIQPDGSGFKRELSLNRDMKFPDTARFRLVLKNWLLEFYLDDILLDCYSLPARATGKVGVLGPLPPNSAFVGWR